MENATAAHNYRMQFRNIKVQCQNETFEEQNGELCRAVYMLLRQRERHMQMASDLENAHLRFCMEYSSYMFRYVFPILLCINLFGNVNNIYIYSHYFAKSSTTIRMLSAKCVCNIWFLLSLLPNCLMEYGRRADTMVKFFWVTQPYMLVASNTFGTCACWLTVLMTTEQLIFIRFPVHAKTICTQRNTSIALAVIFVCGLVLNFHYPITREIKETTRQPDTLEYEMTYRSAWAITYEQGYLIVHALVVQVLPIGVLVALSVVICYRLLYRTQRLTTRSVSSSREKRCVTALTITTTFCHIICESPALLIIALKLALIEERAPSFFCGATVIANGLSLANATLPFLIYLGAIQKFRSLFLQTYHCVPPTYEARPRASMDLLSETQAENHSSIVGVRPLRRLSALTELSPCLSEVVKPSTEDSYV